MAERKLTVADVIREVDAIAPPGLAEAWDCAGLQAGKRAQEVRGVLAALDVTEEVVAEALRLGCDMIVAHHPILFRGTKTLCEDEPSGALAAALIRGGIALYTVHTALDRTHGGVNDELARRIGLTDVKVMEDGYVRMGNWDGGDCGALLQQVCCALCVPDATLYGNPAYPARKVGLCSGSGMDYRGSARDTDVYITGDVTHHDALDALAEGLAILDIGHRGGELAAVDVLARGLQTALSGVEYSVRVCVSAVNPYAFTSKFER